ncbi:MAG TPA: hypothetical protein VFF76_07440 [Holophagaceae bacterium]|jgi:hypothetical protein|nr:hypothetical protein [Holophagaceae bacterium]
MPDLFGLRPWIPPAKPDLARLAMEAADAEGVVSLVAWPEADKGGVRFGGLPPFLAWRGVAAGRVHLVLLQPREVGALVPGARTAPLPPRWLVALDLEALARPLRHHPDLRGCVVHAVSLPTSGEAHVRSAGPSAPTLIAAVLDRVSGVKIWSFSD